MAIDYNRETINSGYNLSKINTNFQRIESALEGALSRNGETPNSMAADFDLNGNDVLNVGELQTTSLVVDGIDVNDIVGKPGPKGDKGDKGDAASITVGSTTTSAPGGNASVTNSGTSGAAILNFVIPRGEDGADGVDGIDGTDGVDGINGTNGTDGADGAAATIAVGTVTTGTPGSNVIVTNTGTSSAAVLDFTIPRGDAGVSPSTGKIIAMAMIFGG